MKNDYIGRFFSPGKRFFIGMLLMLVFLLLESLTFRAVMTGFFLVLAVLAGKKILWKNYILLIFFITFFNLLSPWGEVLFSLGPLDITKGALISGLLKGTTFTGLILISLTSIKKGLIIPGKLGGLIGKVFFYFERIFEQKHRLKRHDLIGTLDEILMDTFYESEQD
ncbi:MAG: hypothetical protein JEY91_16800 [Spirochaetaceae bacterium]|nr:hypothetical protein [Spirochaetaceae bacterium]